MKNLLMSWLSSIGVGVVTAIVGGALGGWVANLTVGWQKISSREGNSGYFVLFGILFAAAIGFVVGLVVSRYLAHGAAVPMLKAMGASIAVYAALIGVVAVATRLNADVPPTFEGETLLLAVEVSWPEHQAPKLDPDAHLPYLILAAGQPGAVRGQKYGMMWPADARTENGRLIIPGAVEIWTERGQRLLSANTGMPSDESLWLQVSLPRRPGSAQRQWSEWLPRISGAEPAALGGLRYRYRVVKRSEPVRTQTFGPFTIGTLIHGMDFSGSTDTSMRISANAQFTIAHRGAPITVSGKIGERDFFDANKESADAIEQYKEISAVAVVPGATPALVVQVDASFSSGYTYLLTSDGTRVQTAYLSHVQSGQALAYRLASTDSTLDVRRRGAEGVVDEALFDAPGLYVTASAVLDTRSRTIHRVPIVLPHNELDSKPPLSLAPDESRYARIRYGDSLPDLHEVTVATGAIRKLSLAGAPSPTGNFTDVDRAWFDFYFAWEPDGSGAMHVVPRKSVGAMPHRGTLSEQPGYREYRVAGGDDTLHEAFLAFLERDMQGQRLPQDGSAYTTSTRVKIGDDTVSVNNNDAAVIVFASDGSRSSIVATIARKFDAALATRRYDAHFTRATTP